ncbi:MAG: metallophosphoesterase [Peptostreptococcaceae bacterium]|nr:metallophosphoesterase [Peptostreptococcaceae bacterium]
MALYAIGDLHLSFSTDKPMDIFGPQWNKHYEKIEKNWKKYISEEDTTLIPGDISWAMHLSDARKDLDWIEKLPGRKILLRGNHDYWWTSLKKMHLAYSNHIFVQNNHSSYGEYAICGTRGWVCPNDSAADEHDDKIYRRELARFEMSLISAKKEGWKRIIVMLHYPPTNEKFEPSGFTDLIKKYGVEIVLYGHLHNINSYSAGIKGVKDGTSYELVSSDYIDFKPKLILP